MPEFSISRREILKASTCAAVISTPLSNVLAQSTPGTFMQSSDFAGKSMATILSYDIDAVGVGGIRMRDPYWLSNTANEVGQDVQYVDTYDHTKGMKNGQWIASLALTAGVPAVNIETYAGGISSPNTDYYRAKTSGPISRASGVIIDGNGKVGGFVNGWDTPSDKPENAAYTDPGWKSFGPDIHFYKKGFSGQVFSGNQHVHCGVLVTVGQNFFSPAAGIDGLGAGGQLGWRIDFVRADGQPFRPGVNSNGNPITKISLLLCLWDSRSPGDSGFDGNDSGAQLTAGEPWVQATLRSDYTSQYVTNYGSNMLTGREQWRQAQFYWDVTHTNMVNILNAFGASNYTTPEMLRIVYTSFNNELYDNRPANQLGEFKPGQFGFSFSNMIVDIW